MSNECCNSSCKCGNECKCSKKCCKICFVVSTIVISFLVSFCVVKLFAPCVVKQAMMKEFVEKQMDKKMMEIMAKEHFKHFGHKMPQKPLH